MAAASNTRTRLLATASDAHRDPVSGKIMVLRVPADARAPALPEEELVEAVFHDDADGVIRAIQERGADPELADYLYRNGARPVHMAAINRNWDALGALLRNGASINGGDSRGRTPLHLLARQGDEAAVRRLLLEAYRADQIVDVACETLGTQNTPLHLAVRSKSVDLLVLLLEQAAETATAAKTGEKPQLPPAQLHPIRDAVDDGLMAVRSHLAMLWQSRSHKGRGYVPVRDSSRVLPAETVLASNIPAGVSRAAVAAEAEARRQGRLLAGDGIGMPRDGREMGGGPGSGADAVSRLLLGARWKDVESDPTVEAIKRSKTLGRALAGRPRPPDWLQTGESDAGGGSIELDELEMESKDAAVVEAAVAREAEIRDIARDDGAAAAEAWAGAHAAADEADADEDLADAASVLANGATTPRPELLQGNDFGEMLAQEAAAARAKQNLGKHDKQMARPRGRAMTPEHRGVRVAENTAEAGEPEAPWLSDTLADASSVDPEARATLVASLPPPTIVDAKTSLGETPLLLACRLGNAPAASALVAAGADVTVRTACGRTALGLASAGGFTSLAASLIENCGASLYRWEDASGSTSLESASRLGEPGAVMALLSLEERLRREAAKREEVRRRNAVAAAAVAAAEERKELVRRKKAKKAAREARLEAEDKAYLARCREVRKNEAREHKEGLLALAKVRAAARRRDKEAARDRFEKRQQDRNGGEAKP